MASSNSEKNGKKVSTTGHEWDGIEEYNNPLPRWWLWTFYVTILWAIGYWVVYPAWPTIDGYTRGLFGYSTRADVGKELEALKVQRGENAKILTNASLEQIKADQNLMRFAMAQGKAAFGDNCAPCHGAGGAGAKGYPNLNDDEWIWGGQLNDIYTTLQHGIRSAAYPETRVSIMPAFGKDGILKKQEILEVANFVRSLSGLKVDAKYNLANGEKIFAAQCVSCHGAKGIGNKELGAPALNNAIWLYGSDMDALVETITNSRAGVMPGWSQRLDDNTLKALSVYVHSLGGGQ